MSKEEFISEVKNQIKLALGDEYRIETRRICKNNNVQLTGLMIVKEDYNISPTIYLDALYDAYRDGTDMETIVKSILQLYHDELPAENVDMSFFMDFQRVKDRICYRLINLEKNTELLEHIPHIPFLDMAICFFYAYQDKHIGDGSILIYEHHRKEWNVTCAELYGIAKENTNALYPPEIWPMEEILKKMLTERGKDPQLLGLQENMSDGILPMKVLTNTKRVNGAACILYPDILEKAKEAYGTDLFILPSSVHEVILMPKKGDENIEELRALVQEVNRTQLDETEILSDNLYFYDSEEKKIILL